MADNATLQALGEMQRKIDRLIDRWDERERRETALPSNIAALQTQIDALDTRVDALETHTHAWNDITNKPTTFTPADHGNEAHTPDFAASAHGHDYSDISGQHSSSAHSVAYAAALHDNTAHNPQMAEASHDHDSSYASAGHNHDGAYSAVGHTHSYASTTHIHDVPDVTAGTHKATTTTPIG
jgi:hypothetical protein